MSWLLEAALPLWGSRGYDQGGGGYFDSLTSDTAENAAAHKRLRVLARQTYVFAEGARLGYAPGRDLVAAGLDFLLARARSPDGGFCSRFAMDGAVIDDGRDLYDLAFTLFALAHGWDVLRDARLRREAELLYAFLDARLAHPRGGFAEGIPAKGPRRQNPHMHLLEALLAWAAIEEGAWRERAGRMARFAVARFVDPRSGALTEYFEEDWSPLPGDEGRVVEPGHQFEWVWLLARHEAATGQTLPELEGFYDFAWRHGVDAASGLLRAEVLSDGTPRPMAVRLWPHTEWLKGEIAMWERSGNPLHAARAVLAGDAMAAFIDVPVKGLYHERHEAASGFVKEAAPASSLYHVTLAVAELNRVCATVNAE